MKDKKTLILLVTCEGPFAELVQKNVAVLALFLSSFRSQFLTGECDFHSYEPFTTGISTLRKYSFRLLSPWQWEGLPALLEGLSGLAFFSPKILLFFSYDFSGYFLQLFLRLHLRSGSELRKQHNNLRFTISKL